MRRALIGLPLAGAVLGFLLLEGRAGTPTPAPPSRRPPGENALPPPTEEGLAGRGEAAAGGPPEIEVRTGGCLFGSVTGVGGLPVEGASVAVLYRDSGPGGVILADTDADGRFRIEGIPLTDVSLHVQHARYTPILRERILLDDAHPTREVNLVVDEGSTLSGCVLDDLGLPVAGAAVIAANEVIRTGRSDKDGFFSVTGLGTRNVTVTVIAPGYATTSVRGLAPGSPRADIRLSPAGTLSGTLEVDPLPRSFTVHLTGRDAERGTFCRVRTQTFPGPPRGEFSIPDLAAGSYGVEVEAPGFDVLDLPQVLVSPKRISEGTRIRLRARE